MAKNGSKPNKKKKGTCKLPPYGEQGLRGLERLDELRETQKGPSIDVAFTDYVNGDTKNDIRKGPKDCDEEEEERRLLVARCMQTEVHEYYGRDTGHEWAKEPLHSGWGVEPRDQKPLKPPCYRGHTGRSRSRRQLPQVQ